MAICILAVSAVTVAAEEPAAERFDIEFAQVVLGNALNIRFAFASEHRSDWTGAYAIAVKTYADGREDCVQRVDAAQWKSVRIDGKAYYYFSFTNISGKEMTDEIHVTVYDSAGNTISNPYTDSIRAYVMRTLEKQGRKTQTMLVDMLNYGAAAQQYYGYGTDDLANCLLTSAQKAYGTQVLSPCRDIRDADANYLGTRLELKSSIVMQMGFRNITADMTAKVELTNHRGEMISKTVSPVSVGSGRLGIAVDQIVVADCRQATTVTVYNADGSIYATVTDSLESYIARMSDSDVLFEAIMKFADSSHAYLHESDTPAGIYLRTDDDGASYIVSSVGAGAASEIVIPETYQGKPVTQIAPDAFRNCTGLTKIVIPATITDVGADAFSGCTGLETICFEGTQEQWDAISKGSDWDKDCPYTLTFHIKGHRLGDWEIVREATCTEAGERRCYYTCGYRYGAVQTHDFTVKHEIPENKVPNQQEPACGKGYLYYCACSRCGKLANNLTDTFEGIEKKACVPKPDYLPLAGDAEERHIFCENCGKILSSAPHAFGEYELTKSPSCYQEGGEVRTCSTCGYQDSRPVDERPHQLSQEIFVVTTPIPGQAGETVYRHALVYRCVNYVHCEYEEAYSKGLAYTFSTDKTYYIVSGIGDCTDTEIVIPAIYEGLPVKEIGANAFKNKTTITSVVVPEGVTAIGKYAFYSCDSLSEITLPDSLTSIGYYAFAYCTQLDYIYYEGTTEQWNAVMKATDWANECTYTLICQGDA